MAEGRAESLLEPFVLELSGVYTFLPLLPLLLWFFNRFPLVRGRVLRRLPGYLAVNVLIGVAHTTLMTLSRSVLFPPFGLGEYHPGVLLCRYLMELNKQVLIFWSVFAIVKLFESYRVAQQRRLRTLQLEGQLTRARLQALQMQLNPHFLFNTLNMISSVMYENLAVADRMISSLSDLLRAALSLGEAQEVPLVKEVELAGYFLDLTKARFGERFEARVEIGEGTEQAMFPTLVIQPLIENAAKHSLERPGTAVEVIVRSFREDGRLTVTVTDNGPGIDLTEGAQSPGVGLSSIRERLHQLYRNNHLFRLENSSDGGVMVTIQVPFHMESET